MTVVAALGFGLLNLAGWLWFFGLWPLRPKPGRLSPSAELLLPVATHPAIEPHLLRFARWLSRVIGKRA